MKVSNIALGCRFAALGFMSLLLWSSAAEADAIYQFNTSVHGNSVQEGTATFDFTDANDFTLSLSNTGNVTDIASILDGFEFTENGAVTTISLTAFSAPSSVNCSTNTCIDGAGSTDKTLWGVALSGNTSNLTAGAGGALHPDGIVNDSVDGNVPAHGSGGLANSQHNPNFFGPVVFTFQTTGELSIPTITGTTFEFGTQPADITGTCVSDNNCDAPPCTSCGGGQTTVPEPSGVAVLAAGLFGLGYVMRRRRSA